ncbi:hypothetical protein GTO36_04270 [bacterium]|nr:hypothetical protein [bacterium]
MYCINWRTITVGVTVFITPTCFHRISGVIQTTMLTANMLPTGGSATAVSKQAGAAVLLRRMAEKGSIEFILPTPIGPEETLPLIRYSSNEKSTYAENLQGFLNKFPGIYVKVDGYPGEKTSDAFKKITGYYLYGDPRAET